MNLLDTIPEPIAIITRRPSTPTTVPGTSVPPQTLPIIVKNNPQLALKPQSPPPHPTITQVLTAIPLGFKMAYQQLQSPTVYGNQIAAYKIYKNTTANSFSGSTLWETRPHDNALGQRSVTLQDSSAGGGQQWYYFVTSVDTTGQESTAAAFQAGAVTSANANPTTASATGSTNNPSTTTISYVVIPEMTVTATFTGKKVLIVFTGSFGITTTSSTLVTTGEFAIFKDGSQLTPSPGYFISNGANESTSVPNTQIDIPVSISFLDQPNAGSHTYDVRWAIFNGPGTLNGVGTARTLQVVELG